MNRTNTQTKTTVAADCKCKPKASPSGKVWQKANKTAKAKAAPPAQKELFTRYDFSKKMPGVALIVPAQAIAPCDLIHIANMVAEEISLMVLNKTARTLMSMYEVDMAEKAKGGQQRHAQPR